MEISNVGVLRKLGGHYDVINGVKEKNDFFRPDVTFGEHRFHIFKSTKKDGCKIH